MIKKKYRYLLRLLIRHSFRYLSDFKIAISAVLVFCLINMAVFVLLPTQPNQLHPLALSRDQSWGIFTSIFVHENFDHLSTNLRNLLLTLLFFFSLSQLESHSSRIRWSKRFVWLSLVAGIVANAICYLFNFQLPSAGASGVVASATGILLGRLILDQPAVFKKISIKDKSKKKQLSLKQIIRLSDAIRGMFSWAILFIIAYPLITDFTTFFNITDGVAWAIHILGFSLGLSIAFLLSVRDYFSNRTKT